MGTHEASRTLVKSPPELWAECSNAASLARHLGQFGEIRITKLEPETAVAWEGSAARGTVRLEPAGWGTKVFLTASKEEPTSEAAVVPPPPEAAVVQPPPEPAVVQPPPEPVASTPPEPEPEPEPPARRRPLARLLGLFRAPPEPTAPEPQAEPTAPEPQAEPTVPEPQAEPTALEPEAQPTAPEPQPQLAPEPAAPPENPLDAALDSLGSAHHRPYSRA